MGISFIIIAVTISCDENRSDWEMAWLLSIYQLDGIGPNGLETDKIQVIPSNEYFGQTELGAVIKIEIFNPDRPGSPGSGHTLFPSPCSIVAPILLRLSSAVSQYVKLHCQSDLASA
jgi:hypothetical protein